MEGRNSEWVGELMTPHLTSSHTSMKVNICKDSKNLKGDDLLTSLFLHLMRTLYTYMH